MFKVCARTILALGAELISSDIVAFYELIKNAFDAKSPSGAEIRFEITLRQNEYLRFRRRLMEKSLDILQFKVDLNKVLNSSAPIDSLDRCRKLIDQAEDSDSLVMALDQIRSLENRIIVSDTGTGMSQQDLINNFLTIGTPSRKREIDAALADPSSADSPPPYLGEKGIGRLSTMRLGNFLSVETAEEKDTQFNVLNIDWSLFDNLDTTLDKISISPIIGEPKPDPNWSGTRLIIRSLNADWTKKGVEDDLCGYEFTRLTDPFVDTKRRPRIVVYWNDERIPIVRMDKTLLEHAHASIKGKYIINDFVPKLKCSAEAMDLGFKHPYERKDFVMKAPDLEGLVIGAPMNKPLSTLIDIGEFQFEAYWFNRRRLGRIDSIGDRKEVRDLQKRWSGILLFRDGFRVLPYGEDDDDWLGLDSQALGSKGYLLNKAQFIGRVTISRLKNPNLIDQTNRQGLSVCPEQQALLDLIKNTIQDRLREFLKDITERYKVPQSDLSKLKIDVSALEKRVESSLNQLRQLTQDSNEIIDELDNILGEIRKSYIDTESNLRLQLNEARIENRQMIQMAGVGLLVEVVAHELARSTENALIILKNLSYKNLPDQVCILLNTLQSEMSSVSKRLRVLDPLSISGRQRKEIFVLNNLIQDTLKSHEQQFKRHGISPTLTLPHQQVQVRAVKGMIIQIIENLISNSVYWLDLRKQREPGFTPEISLSLQTDPLTVIFQDNGSGITKENQEKIFRPFFSLKEKTKRRGLGLYIARECAEYHGGTLILDDEVNVNTQCLHLFIFELPPEIKIS